MDTGPNQVAIVLENISKSFGKVRALSNVTIKVNEGEILALLGENGAGKSTLMKILSGLYQPDSGRILISDRWLSQLPESQRVKNQNGDITEGLHEITISNPREGMLLGIGMVYQHFQLVESLTVAENITLGDEIVKSKFVIDDELMFETIRTLSEKYGLPIDPKAKVEDLPVGLKQRVEILKQLYRKANLIIFDEPTAVLTPLEVEELFNTMQELKKAGKSMIFISHKLREPLAIADRIVVMRKGEVVGETTPSTTTMADLATMVVGKKIVSSAERAKTQTHQVLFEVRGLTLENPSSPKPLLNNISFKVHTHEILGIAGIEGNGQTEMVDTLVGLRKPSSGSIVFSPHEGQTVDFTSLSTQEILNSGIAYIPEDRGTQGLVQDFNITENVWLAFHGSPETAQKYAEGQQKTHNIQSKIFLPLQLMKTTSSKIVNTFNVKAQSINQQIKNLSGGNQQKVILGREFAKNPKLVIASQPTRGVDIGVMEQVHTNLINLRNEGAGIVLVSADLDEILKLADRIVILYEGQIVGEMNSGELDLEELSHLMISGTYSEEENTK